MRILVTGGLGLIGSHLSKVLRDGGHEVAIIDDFRHTYLRKLPETLASDVAWRFERLLSGIEIERCCITEKRRLAAIVRDIRPDCIVHLAAVPLVSVATQNPEMAAQSLSGGLINLLEILREAPGVRRFVYASSSMVYGNFARDPMPEDGPLAPLNVYGGLKLAGEVLTRSYLHPTGIEHVIVRPTAVYGPTDHHRRVVQKFCESALDGTPLYLNAANDRVMDFTYIEDVVEGFRLCAEHDAAADQTFNISYGSARRLSDVAALLRTLVPGLSTSSEPIDDADRPRRGALDCAKARKLLGFSPEWPLERGLPAYLQHIRLSRGEINASCVA